jgi:hypothetical protein
MIPDEVSQLRDATGKPDAIRQALAQVDSSFAAGLDSAEIDQISQDLS